VKEGGKRRADGMWRGEDDDRLVVGEDEEETERKETDTLYRVEREQADMQRGKDGQGAIALLVNRNARMKDDFAQSLLMRGHMRREREVEGRGRECKKD
jgi:hypothetical protein